MFPNKIIPIQESLFPIMVDIVRLEKSGKERLSDMYKELDKRYDTDMIIDSFDVLYAMRYIEIDDRGCLHVIQDRM